MVREISLIEAEGYAEEAIKVTIEDAVDLLDIMELFEDLSEEQAGSVLNLVREAKIEVSW